MTSIADTGFIVALINTNDKNHRACQSVYKQESLIYLPQSTLAEVTYLLRREIGAMSVIAFLVRLPESKYQLIPLEPEDIHRTAELLQKYADTRVDFVDASIAAVAERLNITRVLTLDQRDFSIIRPKHGDYFELLPAKLQN